MHDFTQLHHHWESRCRKLIFIEVSPSQALQSASTVMLREESDEGKASAVTSYAISDNHHVVYIAVASSSISKRQLCSRR